MERSVIDEKTYTWMSLTEGQQFTVASVHAKAMKQKTHKILRLLNLGQPKIIFGPNFSYCRIHPDSVEVIQLILTNYL